MSKGTKHRVSGTDWLLIPTDFVNHPGWCCQDETDALNTRMSLQKRSPMNGSTKG
ncbi:MAG TPA: hypothetical protein V6D27_03060 [Vampirovibrionales bacterium]